MEFPVFILLFSADLHEQSELLVLLLAALDELQSRRLVAAESPHSAFNLLLFLPAELEQNTQTQRLHSRYLLKHEYHFALLQFVFAMN